VHLLQRWWLVLLIVGALAGAGGLLFELAQQRAAEQAAAQLTPTPTPAPTPTPTPAPTPTPTPTYQAIVGLWFVAENTTYTSNPEVSIQAITRPDILGQVIDNLNLDLSSEELRQKIEIHGERSPLFDIVVTDSNEELAHLIAQELAIVFLAHDTAWRKSQFQEQQERLQQALEELQQNIQTSRTRLNELQNDPAANQEEITRQQTLLNVYQGSYDSLLTRLQETVVADLEEDSPWELFSTTQSSTVTLAVEEANGESTEPEPEPSPEVADEPEPDPRNPWLTALLAAIVGVLLAGGIIYTSDQLDTTIRDVEYLEALAPFPLLATIGHIDDSEPDRLLIAATNDESPITEAYRMVLVRQGFSALHQPFQVMLITSSLPGEGKSVTAANLAVALAQMGRRVVLVDANMRQPAAHTFFAQPNTSNAGLAALLQPRTTESLAALLLPTAIQGLRLLPAGTPTRNPVSLLASQRLAEVVEMLKAEAEVVLIDTPSILGAADTMLISHLCDALLLVVRPGRTKADALQQASTVITERSGVMVGIIVNDSQSGYAASPTTERQQ
jgi:non-specific protein-tyrosine kinase